MAMVAAKQANSNELSKPEHLLVERHLKDEEADVEAELRIRASEVLSVQPELSRCPSGWLPLLRRRGRTQQGMATMPSLRAAR